MKKRHEGGLMVEGLPWPAREQERTTVLPADERAELQRQGAKAAARGDPSEANPMCDSVNLPAATGELPEHWSERQEAWQAGHDAYEPGKPAAAPALAKAGHDGTQ